LLVKIHVIVNCICAHDGDITRIQFISYARRLPTRCSWPQFVEETFFGLLSRRNSICHEISYHDSRTIKRDLRRGVAILWKIVCPPAVTYTLECHD